MADEFRQAYKDHNKSFWSKKQSNCDWITWCGGWMLYDADLFVKRYFD